MNKESILNNEDDSNNKRMPNSHDEAVLSEIGVDKQVDGILRKVKYESHTYIVFYTNVLKILAKHIDSSFI